MTRGAYNDARDELGIYTTKRVDGSSVRVRVANQSVELRRERREFGRAPLVTRDDWSTSLLCLLLPLGILRTITVLTNNPRLSTDGSSPAGW